jgi:cobalt-zinc-cadmium efflux system protein
MSGSHEAPENLDKNMRLGLLMNTAYTIFEFIIGFFAGSLALISDAAHNLTDSLSLLITFTATKIAKKQANSDKTYGYGRATILAALINSVILLILSGYIFYEAYLRILNPEPVEGKLVMIVAFFGILVNGSIALLFFKNKNDLNVKSAFLNMALDALASVGALIAGLIIFLTNNTIFDPIISIIIGLMLLYSGWSVIKEALHVLLDGVPEGMNVAQIKQAILTIDGVKGMDDLHVWALSTQEAALSAHVVVKKCTLEESLEIKDQVKEMLHTEFDIEHATIETELIEGPHHNERTDEGM